MATFHTCLTFGLILLQKSSMDWAINESWCQQISFKSSPKVETSVVTLGQLMLQNGLLFISTSGHTGCIRPQNRSRVQCDQIGLFWNILAAKFRPKLYLAAFWAIWKNITLYVKPTMTFKILPKWQNINKAGHTGCLQPEDQNCAASKAAVWDCTFLTGIMTTTIIFIARLSVTR